MANKSSLRVDYADGRISSKLLATLGVLALALIAVAVYFSRPAEQAPVDKPQPAQRVKIGPDEVQLTPEQVTELNVGPVQSQAFGMQREAIGIIDFNQDANLPVFSPYQGRIQQIFVRAGDDVPKGKILYTVQIPDLPTAASALISAAGNLKVANETLQRARSLVETQSISQKEYQQNQADQQAADAAYRAARKTLTLFGLSNQDIDLIQSTRKIDSVMPVRSAFAGRITARAGSEGQLVQPGSAPAPLTLANIQTLWMVASIPESEIASYKPGQSVSVKVLAYPDQSFLGRITYIADMADANTHRVTVRADIADPKHLLKPQMQASFNFTLRAPIEGVSVPANALARDGDGKVYVWIAQGGANETRFKRRAVQTGLIQNGMVQVTSGLNVGERIARDKALFLSNLLLISTD